MADELERPKSTVVKTYANQWYQGNKKVMRPQTKKTIAQLDQDAKLKKLSNKVKIMSGKTSSSIFNSELQEVITKKFEKADTDENDDFDQYGYGIVPPLYPAKMLVNLVKLLARIYEGYNSKKVRDKTKRLLNMLYKSKIITNTRYNHLAYI